MDGGRRVNSFKSFTSFPIPRAVGILDLPFRFQFLYYLPDMQNVYITDFIIENMLTDFELGKKKKTYLDTQTFSFLKNLMRCLCVVE